MKTLFLGDVTPTDLTSPLFGEEKTLELFGDTVSLFENKDMCFVNLECALTDHDKAIEKFGPALKAPFETANILKEIGVTCCGLSNNHIFDFGIKGAVDTMKTLDSVGIKHTGFGENYEDSRKNLVIEKDGEKLCIITVCEHEYSYALENRMGARPFDEYDTLKDIRSAKKENDKVAVIYHGGKEQCRYPSPRLHKLCHAMAESGADLIICQHSHCVGCYEKYEGCHILYGQGNFHFIWDKDYEGWFDCLAVEYDTKTDEIKFTPVQRKGSGIELSKGEDKKELYDGFIKRSESLKDGSWQAGWHEFCERNKDIYQSIVAKVLTPDASQRENDLFGHYLDCEAHLDVWKELFPTYNKTNEM